MIEEPIDWTPVISFDSGQYNLLSTKKEWCLQMRAGPLPWVNQKWDLDEKPEYDASVPPSEVLDILEKRLKMYWLNSRRDEDQDKLNLYKKNIVEIDRAWAIARVIQLQKGMARTFMSIQSLKGSYIEPQE